MTGIATAFAPAALIAVSACTSWPPAGPKPQPFIPGGAVPIGATAAGSTQASLVGIYLCTTDERAAIASQHREGAGPPSARVDDRPPTIFKMQITPTHNEPKQYQVVEIAHEGPARDMAVWQDENSVLHSTYIGDGSVFHAVDGPAFLTLGRRNPGDLNFYHAGFEDPGGVDTQLAIRWGRCRRAE